MKKILLIALTLFFAIPNLQAKGDDEDVKIVLVKEENSDNYYYEGVVPVEGMSKEEMFKRAKAWVLANFKTGDNNSQIDEDELSIINSSTVVLPKFKSFPGDFLNFKIILLFKDGKYKFRFDNLIVQANGYYKHPVNPYSMNTISGASSTKYNKRIVVNVNERLLELSESLEKAIKANTDKKDDW